MRAILCFVFCSLLWAVSPAESGEWKSYYPSLSISGGSGNEPEFAWDGRMAAGYGDCFGELPKNSGGLLYCQLSYRVLKHTPGFRFAPEVRLLDAKGKTVSSTGFGEGLPSLENTDCIDFEEYVRIPKTAVKYQFILFLSGNEGRVRLFSRKFTRVEKRRRSESMRYTQFQNPHRLTDAQLDARLKAMQPNRAELRHFGDYNSIFVNGREMPSPLFYSTGYNHIPGMRYNMAKEYNDKAGIPFFSLFFNLGLGRPCHQKKDIWLGPGKYDVAVLKAEIRKLLKENPDAKILLHASISPYRGYATAYPDELYRGDNGEFGSYYHGYLRSSTKTVQELPLGKDGGYSAPSNCSLHYLQTSSRALEDVLREIALSPEGKPVIAVYVNGGTDGQWFDQFDGGLHFSADYSPAARKRFRSYLLEKYHGDVQALRAAWRNPKADFENVPIPSHNELWNRKQNFHTLFQTSSSISDYCEFLGWCRGQQQISYCDAVKRSSGGRWLAGSYFSNSGLRGYPQLGLQSLRFIMEAPSVDLLAVVPHYHRNFFEPVHLAAFDGTITRHGKLLVTELDLRNGELPYWGRWGTDFWRSHNDGRRFPIEASRFAANAFTMGGSFHIYDMEGGCFNSQLSIQAWKKTVEMMKERSDTWNPQDHMAIVAGEQFWCYQSFGKGRITVYTVRDTVRHACYRAGVRHKAYLLDDVLKPDFQAPKLMVFLDSGTMTRAQYEDIQRRYANSGRVLVWMWLPGMFTDEGKDNGVFAPSFKLKRSPAADDRPLFADGRCSDPLMKDVKGFLYPYMPEYGHGWGMAYTPADPEAKILANYFGTKVPGMAVKRHKDFTEVWCGAPGSLTPQLCRNFAREAEVPVFLDSDDFSGLGAGILYLSALTCGEKVISLPEDLEFVRVLTNQKVDVRGNRIAVTMKTGDLLVLKVRRK